MTKEKKAVTSDKDKNTENKGKNDRAGKLLCFSAAFLFSFSLLIYGPLEIFLTNLDDLAFMGKYVLISCIPTGLATMALLYLLLRKLPARAANILLGTVYGLSFALYVQGNFLQLSARQLDGTPFASDAAMAVINTAEWIVLVAAPFLVNRYFREYFVKAMYFLTVMITVMQLSVFASLRAVTAGNAHRYVVVDMEFLTSDKRTFMMSHENEYLYSKDRNLIIFLADEYDSFYFDAALEENPELREVFKDFTYYKDTVGKFSMTTAAVTHIFSQSKVQNDFGDTVFFPTLAENGYRIGLYCENYVLPYDIFEGYGDNFIKYRFTLPEKIEFGRGMYSLVFYKYFPELLKPFFYMTNNDVTAFTSASDSYAGDNYDFYTTLGTPIELTDEKCFKFLYISGLHGPRTTDTDMNRVDTDSISVEDTAVVTNRIFAEYLEKLKENGVYDNSDIVILADHGLKEHDVGIYPLLMIKRRGETGDSLTVSDIKVSYDNMYPTLLYLAGGEPSEKTVFDLTEEDNGVRYVGYDDNAVCGHIK